MLQKVLVTGVAGFIGSNLAERLLASGYQVIGIDDLSYGLLEQVPKGVDFHQLDIRSPEIYPLFHGVDAVFHLAAKNCISDCQADPVATASINVVGTVNVLEAASRAHVRKVINAESSAIYEGSVAFPTPEEFGTPQSFYADSKLALHLFTETFIRDRKLPIVSLRYFNVYGPRQDYRRTTPPLMSDFIIKLSFGKKPVLYGGGHRRKDYIYVDDLNDFHLLVLEKDEANNQIYNVGSGVSTSVAELFEAISRVMNVSIEPDLQPDISDRVEETRADITKARSLGWAPKTSLEDGLRASVSYIREYVLPKINLTK